MILFCHCVTQYFLLMLWCAQWRHFTFCQFTIALVASRREGDSWLTVFFRQHFC